MDPFANSDTGKSVEEFIRLAGIEMDEVARYFLEKNAGIKRFLAGYKEKDYYRNLLDRMIENNDFPWNYEGILHKDEFVKLLVERMINLKETFDCSPVYLYPAVVNKNVTLDFVLHNSNIEIDYTDLCANTNIPLDFILSKVPQIRNWDADELSTRSDITPEFVKQHEEIEWNWGSLFIASGKFSTYVNRFLTDNFSIIPDDLEGSGKQREIFVVPCGDPDYKKLYFEDDDGKKVIPISPAYIISEIGMRPGDFSKVTGIRGDLFKDQILDVFEKISSSWAADKGERTESINEKLLPYWLATNQYKFSYWLMFNPSVTKYPNEIGKLPQTLKKLVLLNKNITGHHFGTLF